MYILCVYIYIHFFFFVNFFTSRYYYMITFSLTRARVRFNVLSLRFVFRIRITLYYTLQLLYYRNWESLTRTNLYTHTCIIIENSNSNWIYNRTMQINYYHRAIVLRKVIRMFGSKRRRREREILQYSVTKPN